MADLGFNFNSDEVKPSSGTGAMPVGEYIAVVTESAIKPTKAGTGKVIHLVHEVVGDGEFKGRKFWNYINIVNPSKQAQDIGRAEFSALCKACGKVDIQDTAALHSIPIKVNLGLEASNKDASGNLVTQNTPKEMLVFRNVVKGYVWKDSQVSAGSPSANAGGHVVDSDDVPF